jgi:hypothetical protein
MRDRPEEGEKLELVRGSGNGFRDLGRESADLEQLKAFWLLTGRVENDSQVIGL